MTLHETRYDTEGWPLEAWCDQCQAYHPVDSRQEMIEQADAADIDEQLEECAYCGVVIGPVEDQCPSQWNDEAWNKLAKLHAPDCEWIVTRAHRIDVVVRDSTRMWSRANDLAQGDPLRRSYWLDYFRHGGWS